MVAGSGVSDPRWRSGARAVIASGLVLGVPWVSWASIGVVIALTWAW